MTGLRAMFRGSSIKNDRGRRHLHQGRLEEIEPARLAALQFQRLGIRFGAGPASWVGVSRVIPVDFLFSDGQSIGGSICSARRDLVSQLGIRKASFPVGASAHRPAGRQMVGDRPQDDGRHERQGADQEHRPQQHDRKREIVGQATSPTSVGTRFFSARKPAMAIGSTSAGNRPSKRTTPVAMFHAGLLSARPSKPDPLLAAAEVNS